jgi:glutathione S-transferase
MWLAFRVPRFRRKAGVGYPHLYATPEQIDQAPTEDKKLALYLFNCAQRGHHHFLEHYSSTLAALLIAGLKYPVTSAALGVLWSIGRVLYATGYTLVEKKNGSGRHRGTFFWVGQVGLYALVVKTGYDLLMA